MEAKNLMIGDWVYHEEGYHLQVCDELNQTQFCSQYGIVQLEYCKPIPLTEDILFINTGSRSKMKLYTSYLLYCEDEVNYLMQGYVEVWFDNDDTFHFHSKFDNGYSIDGEVHYIHELQHALRLCGLRELADNFKVE